MALGYSHPDHLLRELSSWQVTEWLAYYGLEPFGEERSDLRAGIVAATVANANRDAKRRAKPFEPGEFMPKFGGGSAGMDGADESAGADWQGMLAMVVEWNAAMGGEDLRGREVGD